LTRVEIYKNELLLRSCFISSIGFLKVRIAPEDLGPQLQIEPLSMTRIHTESYNIAIKVACDTLHEDVDMNMDMEINPDNLDSEMSK
jgi:transcriptional accessory protein Tex/SPT6